MGGGEKFSKVLSSLTLKTEQVTGELYKVEPSGSIDIMNALKIASLILKNREQKHYYQRIVLFVASPIKDKFTTNEYKAMGEQLKSAGISLDVISTGEISDNYDKLHALFDGAKKNSEDSHFLTLAGGAGSLTDVLLCSSLLNPSSSGTGGGGAGGGAGNAEVEDDLARAIRESMAENDAAIDEELQRAMMASLMDFNAQNNQNNNNNNTTPEPQKESNQAPPPPQPAAPAVDDDFMDIDDEELREAIRMSLMDAGGDSSSTTTEEPKKEEEKKKDDDGEKKKSEGGDDDKGMVLDNIDPTKLIDDPDYVNSVLSGLDGVDPEEAKKYLNDKKDDGDDDKDKKK